MDEELSELERSYRSDPGQPELAARFEAALRRSGERETLDAEYRLAYRCPLAWDALPGDPHDEIRACERCSRDVYYVRTREDMARWIGLGECVALDPSTLEETIPVLVDLPQTELTQYEGRLCVQEVTPGSEPESLQGMRGYFTARVIVPPELPEQEAIANLLQDLDARSDS